LWIATPSNTLRQLAPFPAPQAALIEYNLDAVDAAINAVREAVASGMDWRDLARMIKVRSCGASPLYSSGLQIKKLVFTDSRGGLPLSHPICTGCCCVQEERRAGNPVAGLIDSLQLERSRVTLLLRWVSAGRGWEWASVWE